MADQPTPVTGVLRIEIPSPALSVTLTFEVSEEGDEWDVQRVAGALAERGVTGVPEDQILRLLKEATSAGGPVAATVLEGSPPELPSPERVEWAAPGTEGCADDSDAGACDDDAHRDGNPEDGPASPPAEDASPDSPAPTRAGTDPATCAAVRERVLERAPSPQIFRDVREKVEKQKTVEKKGLLGIGQGKTETTTVTETVTRREKVYVDPTVQESRTVTEGEIIGTVVPATPGAPGKDVFGRPVAAKQLSDPRFYLGDNITRRGDELVAEVEGFLRVGSNWVDIIAFSSHRWSVELSPDQATCYLTVTPGHPDCPAPTGAAVLEAAIALPYPEGSLMSAEELNLIIAGQIESGETATMPISSSRDASFDIVIPEDKLSALLYIHKGKGRGRHLNLKEIGAAIKASKLKSLDFQKIGDDIKAFYVSNEFDLTGYVLTEGVAPVPGPARQIEFSLRFDAVEKTDRLKEALQAAAPEDQPESLSEFPVQAIQKTARVEHEQLVATIDPETPGTPGTDVYGATLPGPTGPAPTLHLYENVIQKNAIVATTAPGVLDFAEIDGEYHLRVRAHIDAEIEVELAADRMSAFLSLREGAGTGERLQRERIDGTLEGARVVHGIEEEIVARALEAARAGTEVTRVIVARGTPPVDQSENTLEMLVDTAGGEAVRIRQDGTADYRTRNTIATVEKGQALCRILPSQQEPIDGTTVTGETLPARTVTGLELELGENVQRVEREDGSVLILAETEGELHHEKNRIAVRTTHSIKGDVDMSVGNVRFPGSVLIGGTVRTGFYVMSGGDIKIAGGVEGALLSSDGDIVIKQGVKGAGKAVLRSKRNIMSPFVELATVLSVGDVVLKTAVVRSRVKCNGRILFQGDKGRLVGGTVRARDGLEATSIGSPRGVRTYVSFGQDYLIADLIEKEEKEIEKVKARISQIDIEMRKAEKASATDQLQTFRQEKVKMLKLMEKRGLRLFTLRERFEQHFPSKVIVRGEVHSGTIFESHGRVFEVTRLRKGISVEFDPQTGNLDVSDLNGESGS
jgi:uncharacterized protein